MDDVNKILIKMGYLGDDPLKKAEIAGYVSEAEEYMAAAGVPREQMTTETAYAVKSIWADKRDKNDDETLIRRDGIIVHLIAQLRR